MTFHNISYQFNRQHFTADIELTNKCNLHCEFCPREEIPRTGFMAPDTFAAAIERIRELPWSCKASCCGTGDSILHPQLPDFIEHANAQGVPLRLTTSATLLDEKKAQDLLAAGLQEIHISVTGIHEDYEKNYHQPFAKTIGNIQAFLELSRQMPNPCDVSIMVVQTSEMAPKLPELFAFWKSIGIRRRSIHLLEEHNRAGSFRANIAGYDNSMIVTDNPVRDCWCPAPFLTMFIGWDGQYYLCSNDWKKEAGFGHVHDTSFIQALRRKRLYMDDQTKICHKCSYHPENYYADISSNGQHPPRQQQDVFLRNAHWHQSEINAVLQQAEQYASDPSA